MIINDKYPTLKEAQKIWQEGFDYRSDHYNFANAQDYIFHTHGVAESAQKIASKTMYLNSEKAYILGLLHDYGKKYDEKIDGIFHGQAGYEEFNAMGYGACAKICLTHSFPKKDFSDFEYGSYLPQWIKWARERLSKVEYDDYDRLIQLCDMFFEGTHKVSFEHRFAGIQARYHLKPEQTANALKYARINKSYFEKLCGVDIYDLLKIK